MFYVFQEHKLFEFYPIMSDRLLARSLSQPNPLILCKTYAREIIQHYLQLPDKNFLLIIFARERLRLVQDVSKDRLSPNTEMLDRYF